jgi:Flp pilus assembly protein TadG
MAMPVLMAVALAMVWLVSLGVTQLRVQEAARETARAAARGDADPEALARRVAPDGARVSVSNDGRIVTVTVGAGVPGPGGIFSFVPSPRVEATSVAARE